MHRIDRAQDGRWIVGDRDGIAQHRRIDGPGRHGVRPHAISGEVDGDRALRRSPTLSHSYYRRVLRSSLAKSSASTADCFPPSAARRRKTDGHGDRRHPRDNGRRAA
jgi:hypothetical protein